MDIIKISKEITRCILALRKLTDELDVRVSDKAYSVGEYEKKLAQTMLELRNGKVVLFDGKEESYSQTTGLERVAKGICYKERIKQDLTDSALRALYVKMDNVKTEIMALQSKLKYIESE